MHTTRWQLDLSNGQSEPFDHVILCAGPATHALLSQVLSPDRVSPLTPVRGQLSWGHIDENLAPLLPSHPVNGDGSFLGCVPDESGCLWMAGSTFDRHRHTAVVDEQDHLENLDRLKGLLPEVASHLVQQLARGKVQAWAGVRCTTPDRLPRVGAPSPDEAPGLHVLTGLGARGLTLSVLCGQWLAAQLCGEPLPLEPDLSRRLLASRT
jgi:tRNA 5-methylaminomethyl-2-thiouridine biosynthesis bifunctional protein